MPHGIWNGDIHFGLVYIPVTLYSAESHKCEVKLHLLDKRDLAPIGFQKFNKNTGEKVPPEQVVEGYEYEDNSYVVLTKEELKKIHPASSQSIEILEFVDARDIEPEYFDRPYYLEPRGKGDHGYALLREALRRTKKAGIAKVVIRTRQYLGALMVEGNAIMLEILRFPCELVDQEKFKLPPAKFAAPALQSKEIEIAEELINSMSKKWKPSKYENEYQGSLLDYVMEKIKMGESETVKEAKAPQPKEKGKVIDIMDLLKKSIQKKRPESKSRSKTSSTRKNTRSPGDQREPGARKYAKRK